MNIIKCLNCTEKDKEIDRLRRVVSFYHKKVMRLKVKYRDRESI